MSNVIIFRRSLRPAVAVGMAGAVSKPKMRCRRASPLRIESALPARRQIRST